MHLNKETHYVLGFSPYLKLDFTGKGNNNNKTTTNRFPSRE